MFSIMLITIAKIHTFSAFLWRQLAPEMCFGSIHKPAVISGQMGNHIPHRPFSGRILSYHLIGRALNVCKTMLGFLNSLD